jgi:hypothetical protein
VKVYCKRTYLDTNQNFFKIRGKGYGESYAKWEKDKYYSMRLPEQIEREMGILYYIQTEVTENIWSPIKKKEFDKYFTDIDELRNNKIEQILNGTSEI